MRSLRPYHTIRARRPTHAANQPAMAIAYLDEASFSDTRVLCRVDFNVPLTVDTPPRIADDFRIRAALKTINRILDDGGSAILMSHLGRPKGVDERLRLAPVATRLAELLNRPVDAPRDCVGAEARAACAAMKAGDVTLLENLRFHAGECASDSGFGRQLAELATLGGVKGAYVSDAFGTAHRADASMVEPAKHLRAYAGYLMQAEITYFTSLLQNPARPLVVVLGGAKVADKLALIDNLSRVADVICIGGAMAYTFLAAHGEPVGQSLVEQDLVAHAAAILRDCAERDVRMVLACDHVVAARIDAPEADVDVVATIPDDRAGFDIGPATRRAFAAEIAAARTVLFNGPVGVFERAPFASGTRAVCEALGATTATTVVGGGDAVAAVGVFGVRDQLSHVSTGGGASLAFLEGRTFPGVAALDQ